MELGLEREIGGGLNMIEKHYIYMHESIIMKPNIMYNQYNLIRDIKTQTKQTDKDRLWSEVAMKASSSMSWPPVHQGRGRMVWFECEMSPGIRHVE